MGFGSIEKVGSRGRSKTLIIFSEISNFLIFRHQLPVTGSDISVITVSDSNIKFIKEFSRLYDVLMEAVDEINAVFSIEVVSDCKYVNLSLKTSHF
jgi:hypothetical protein